MQNTHTLKKKKKYNKKTFNQPNKKNNQKTLYPPQQKTKIIKTKTKNSTKIPIIVVL